MNSLLKYVPTHRLEEFIVFTKDKHGILDMSEDEVRGLASEFLFGKQGEVKVVEQKAVEKEEVDLFIEMFESKLNDIDFAMISEISWVIVLVKGTVMYAIEIFYDDIMKKRLVIRDKNKSQRFLSFVTHRWI